MVSSFQIVFCYHYTIFTIKCKRKKLCYILADVWYNVFIMIKLLRNLGENVKNLISWFPIIWVDREYDHYFLFQILRHKLKRMEKFYNGPYAWGMNAPKLAHEMKVCTILLDKIIEDEYNREGYDAHDEKWGKLEFTTNDDGDLTITRGNRNFNEDIEAKEYRAVYEKEEKLKEQDLEMLFKTIRKNIRKWWD